MKVLILGDVGAVGGYHAGDEAIVESVVSEITARTAVDIVLISGDVEDTKTRYGWAAVPRIGFVNANSSPDDVRDQRLRAVLAGADGDASALAWDDPAWQVIHAVAATDAVVISGGGNLNSTSPENVYERAAVAMLAARLNTPVITTGQTVGPHLTARHRELVGEIVTASAAVAAREAATYEKLLDLGVPPERLVSVVDDATYLTPDDVMPIPHQPYILATVSGRRGHFDTDFVPSVYAELLEHIASRLAASVVFVSHQGIPQTIESDCAIHRQIGALVQTASVVYVDEATARQIVALTRSAAAVVTTSLHPIVFALGSGVPVLGIGSDDYAAQSLFGAMDRFGMGDYVVPGVALEDGSAREAADDLLNRQDALREHLAAANLIRRAEQAEWWDFVVQFIVDRQSAAIAQLSTTFVEPFEGGPWAPGMRARRSWSYAVSRTFTEHAFAEAALRERVEAGSRRVDDLLRQVADLTNRLDDERDQVALLRESLEKAHEIISDGFEPVASKFRDLRTVEQLSAELAQIYQTKTFRYLAGPRRLYKRLRG